MEKRSIEQPENTVEKRGWHIEHAEEVMPDGWRLTFPKANLDVPETWAFYDGEGLIVIDPGGELPVETRADQRSLKPLVGLVTGLGKSPKLKALKDLLAAYQCEVKSILLTHVDVDHSNNISNYAGDKVPVYIGADRRDTIVNPELQFAEAKKMMSDDRRTGNDPGELILRDRMFQLAASVLNNDRADNLSDERNTQIKSTFIDRLHDFPPTFHFSNGNIEVYHLPGHAPEEVGFYIPEQKILIGGDLLATSKSERATRLNLFLPEANIYQALDSLAKIEHLDIESFYPAHGPPIIGREKIQEYLATVRQETQQIIDLTIELHKKHPTLITSQLGRLVFNKQLQRPGMNEREQETWVLSILRDGK